jgi:hypothetical protein
VTAAVAAAVGWCAVHDIFASIIYAVPWWVRLVIAVALLAVGIVISLAVPGGFKVGAFFIIAGLVFLCFSSRSDSEKGGYRF